MSFRMLGTDNKPLDPESSIPPRTKTVRGEVFYRYQIRTRRPPGQGQRKQRIWARNDQEALDVEQGMKSADFKTAHHEHGEWQGAKARYSYRSLRNGKIIADTANVTAFSLPQQLWPMVLRPDFDSLVVQLGEECHHVRLLSHTALPLFSTPPGRPRGKKEP